jgi:hypothetical protein
MFVPASYKNMTSGEAELSKTRLGDYYISRARARTRTTPGGKLLLLCVPPCRRAKCQVGAQESPHNTEGLPLFSRGAVRASW